MTEHNNSRFKNQKERFLVNNPVTISGFAAANLPAGGPNIHDFDLQSATDMGGRRALQLVAFANRAKQTVGCRTHRISAYWLPWQTGVATHYDIGNAADYFFTSELNGCQFRVARTGPNTVRCIHVAGDGPSNRTIAGSTWRNNQAQALLTPAQRLASHRFTVSAGLGAVAPGAAGAAGVGAMIGYAGPHDWQNVFGFRHWHVCGPPTWDFYYQTVGIPPGGAAYQAQVALLAHI